MHKSSQNEQSIYVPMKVNKQAHPCLFEFLNQSLGRGEIKKRICDAIERELKHEVMQTQQETSLHRLETRLDEIRDLLLNGNFAGIQKEKSETQSQKVSGLLSAIGY